jgi:hypothetical protein
MLAFWRTSCATQSAVAASEPTLHRLENVFMCPSGDPSLLGGSAAVIDGVALAGVGPVEVQDHPIFLLGIVVGEPFSGWTNVLLRHVA